MPENSPGKKAKRGEKKPVKKVFVNGAGGFVGRYVVEEALSSGYAVVASDLPGKDLAYAAEAGAEVKPGNLLDASFTLAALEGCDLAINVAGIFDLSPPYETLYAANVTAVQNMCRSALANRIERMVHIATVGVYGRPHATPLREEYPLHPRNKYERTKALGEVALFNFHRREGLPVCSLRPGAVYGPWSRYGVAGILGLVLVFSSTWMRRIPLPTRDIYFHIVHARDLARASVFLLEAEGVEGKAFNCGEDHPATLETLFQAFLEPYGIRLGSFRWNRALGTLFEAVARLPVWASRPVNSLVIRRWDRFAIEQGLQPGFTPRFDPASLDYFSNNTLMDTSRLREAGFSYLYPDPVEGLRETLQWYIDQGWLPRHL
jgi:UDP-glucose 4-epimerase